MWMSIQQRYLLDVLKRLGCVRRNQLYILASKNLSQPGQEIASRHVDAMLKQLRYCINEVRMDGEWVFYNRGCLPNQELLEAVDVMLELAEGRPLDFLLGQADGLLLRFTLESEGKLRLFGVARYREDRVRSLPELPALQTERIIFLLGKSELPGSLILPYRHYFALRQEDGSHRFFSSGDQ